jgi:DNA-binding XRE family transcriptional regulator
MPAAEKMRPIRATSKKASKSGHLVIISEGDMERKYALNETEWKRMRALLRGHEVNDDEGSVPAREVLPELNDSVMRPATLLKGSRVKAGMTQVELAKAIDGDQPSIAAMESGRRPIGKAMAKRFAIISVIQN